MTKPKRRRKRKPHTRVKALAPRKKQLAPVAPRPKGIIMAQRDLWQRAWNYPYNPISQYTDSKVATYDEVFFKPHCIVLFTDSTDKYWYRFPIGNSYINPSVGPVDYMIVPVGETFDPDGGSGSRKVTIYTPQRDWNTPTASIPPLTFNNVDDVDLESAPGLALIVCGNHVYVMSTLNIQHIYSDPMP